MSTIEETKPTPELDNELGGAVKKAKALKNTVSVIGSMFKDNPVLSTVITVIAFFAYLIWYGENNPVPAKEPDPIQIETKLSNSHYTIVVDDKSYGPYTMKQIQELINTGSITTETLMWTEGMNDWALSKDIEEIKPLLGL